MNQPSAQRPPRSAPDRWLAALEHGFLVVAGLGLLAIMLVIVVDVVMRYLFSAPLSWSFDLVSLYLVTLVFFMALGDTFRRGGHIKVELFERLREKRFFAVTEILGYGLAVVFFLLILRELANEGFEAWKAGDVLDGAIPWPTWPPYAVAALGVALLVLRLLLDLAGRVAAARAGRPYAPPVDEGGEASAGRTGLGG